MQQFLDKHSRSCWRRPPRYALFLHRTTPTRPGFSRADAAFVGVPLPATPYSSVGSRQHGPTFPGRTPPLFAPPSPLRLIPPSGHANAVPLFPGRRRLCLRRPPRCALFLRRVTPTRSHFSRADVAFVYAALPAAPYFFASPRQHHPDSPGRTPSLFAPSSPLRLISSPGHANTVRIFPDMLAYWDTRKLKKRDSPNNYPAHIHKATSIPNSTVPAPRVVPGYPKAGRLRPPALLGFRIRIRIP